MPSKSYYLSIGKTDILLTTMKVNSQNNHFGSQLTSPISMKCFSWICPRWMIYSVYKTYLSKLFFVSPNFVVAEQYKTKTGSWNIF